MVEICIIHAEILGGDVDRLDLKFNAVRRDGGDWLVFAAARNYGYWILMADMQALTHTIALPREWALLQAKWSVLYGDRWDKVYDDPARVAADHVNALESLGDHMSSLISSATLTDIADWRREMEREPPTTGEQMREQLTGIPLLAARN